MVLDLETTGASPNDCAITEVGAVKYRGGELLGRFETLVNPGVPIPPFITVLTGITEAMLLPAPRIDEVLPPLLEFIGGAVIVGHNIRFDISFLDAALTRPRLPEARATTRRHHRAGAPAGARRGARPQARHARPPPPRLGVAVPPRVRRRRRDRRGAARAARAGRHVRRARSRRPARAAVDPRPPVGEQAAAHRAPPPPARRVPDEGPRRSHPLRRQGDEPPRPRALLLRRRRPPEGAAAAPRDRGDRLDRVPARARGVGPRAAADPGARAAVQPPGQAVAVDRVREAHAHRALPAPHRGPVGEGRRQPLPRPVRVDARRAHGARGDRDRGAPPSLHRAHRPHEGDRRRRAVRARAARRRVLPVPRLTRRGRVRRPSSRPCGAASPRIRACCSTPLERRMHALAEQERFEEAAITRDRVAALAGCCADARRSRGCRRSGQHVGRGRRRRGHVRRRPPAARRSRSSTSTATAAPRPVPASATRPRRCPRTSIAGGPTSCSSSHVGSTGRSVRDGRGCWRRPAHRAHRVRARCRATSRRRAGGSAGDADRTRRGRRSRAPASSARSAAAGTAAVFGHHRRHGRAGPASGPERARPSDRARRPAPARGAGSNASIARAAAPVAAAAPVRCGGSRSARGRGFGRRAAAVAPDATDGADGCPARRLAHARGPSINTVANRVANRAQTGTSANSRR